MSALLNYLVQVIAISAILYGYYHFALRNKKFHQYNRFYLLISTVLSLAIPFLKIPVYFTVAEKESSFILETLSIISISGGDESLAAIDEQQTTATWFTLQNILLLAYLAICFTILVRVLISLFKISRIIKTNPIEKLDNIRLVNTSEPNTPFSFFKWLFWNKTIELQSEKGKQIFRHELFHIQQRHSWDVVFMELITVVLWINPFFHLIKKEAKTIHEFLADQFAMKDTKHWQYAELLLMQAFNTNQHLINPFFHNQIKRRIAMITTSQKPSYQYLRKLMVLPVAAIVIGLFAFSYQRKNENFKLSVIDDPFTVVIDAGHGGTDSGAKAADGTSEKNIVLAIAQKIKSLNENLNIKIILTRENNSSPELKTRSEMISGQKANLFLSLHLGSETTGKEHKKNGFEVFVSKKNNRYYSENKIWATILLNYFMQLHTTNNVILKRDAGIWVLDQADCPAALVECGYLTDSKDLNFIKQTDNQDKIARNILMAIDQYAMQQKSADWQDRKEKASDTSKPVIILEWKALTGKFEGTYDGKKIKEINTYGHPEQLVFIFENGDMVMISKEQSIEIRKKHGNYLEKNITKPVVKEEENENREKIFSKIEITPSFPGGEQKWKMYLMKNLNASILKTNKAPDGAYTVVVQFIVDKDGFISDVKPLTTHGYGMEEEAVRVIKAGPRWSPALQNGKIVKAYKKQPVTFIAGKGEKNLRPAAQITGNELYEIVVKY